MAQHYVRIYVVPHRFYYDTPTVRVSVFEAVYFVSTSSQRIADYEMYQQHLPLLSARSADYIGRVRHRPITLPVEFPAQYWIYFVVAEPDDGGVSIYAQANCWPSTLYQLYSADGIRDPVHWWRASNYRRRGWINREDWPREEGYMRAIHHLLSPVPGTGD